MVLVDSRPAGEVAELPLASVATPGRVPLLFLLADTGGGHRSAARAVAEALDELYPGRFWPVLCDPLAGPGSARVLRWITRLYGPVIRLAPWAWGAVYYACDSRRVMRLLQRTLLALAERPVADAVAAHRPAAIVSFHPLTGGAAVRARQRQGREGREGLGSREGREGREGRGVPVLTVVTDLVTSHAAWRLGPADQMALSAAIVPSSGPGTDRPGGPGADRWEETGLPVTSGFWGGPPSEGERAALRRSLGVSERRFLAVLTGGGEGAGGLAGRAAAIVRYCDDIEVVAICGRNLRLQRRLARLAARAGGRLTVLGFVDNMSDWLRCADVVIAKAGPGTIAEAACCGAPLLLTSHLPGQEKGNARLVIAAGAGRPAARRRQLLRALGELSRDPATLTAMRAASAGLGRPSAAARVAALLAGLTEMEAGLTEMEAGLTEMEAGLTEMEAGWYEMKAGRHG